ncbi:MAG: excinuclease ABC subunit UvrB [Deltaproteobacteria bacterium]|nr:excinuclease ABC subunit UvrB [Deltaproteobacteria bacterium]
MERFRLETELRPAGDQSQAIDALAGGVERGEPDQVLLGITGSGKTFTIANVIERVQRPTLVIAHNKTLAAQLYQEFRELFPHNAVEYFVSYYDYYQPEAYIPNSDTYIEKDATINERIDRLRHSATRAVLTRRDVIVVASVSCIYGIGSKDWYSGLLVPLAVGEEVDRDGLLRRLVDVRYERNDVDFHRGTFRVRGEVVEVFPAYEEDRAVRIEFWGDRIEKLSEIDPLRGRVVGTMERTAIHPNSHYVVPASELKRALGAVREELRQRLEELRGAGKLLEAERLEQRTSYDLEMLEVAGFCTGIENYSRHLTGRAPGEPPGTLIDYFPRDALFVIDESHQTVPQIQAMYRGDRARKEVLVEFGFRLPSALDNRPLTFSEWQERVGQKIFVSATPGDWELRRTGGAFVEQVIRPTGLMDPEIEIRPAGGQVEDLVEQLRRRVEKGERVLVTTLTKRMAEDLTEYLGEIGVRARYMHADIDTLERVEILRDLRQGAFDVLVGINLLREGLDLPEVSLVAVLDADKEGFLRSTRSLVQTCGRAARNVNGKVILYADVLTPSIRETVAETERRRKVQAEYNAAHGIVPATIRKAIRDMTPGSAARDYLDLAERPVEPSGVGEGAVDYESRDELVAALRAAMLLAAEKLDFERAALLRDRIAALSGEAPSRALRGQVSGSAGRPRARKQRRGP